MIGAGAGLFQVMRQFVTMLAHHLSPFQAQHFQQGAVDFDYMIVEVDHHHVVFDAVEDGFQEGLTLDGLLQQLPALCLDLPKRLFQLFAIGRNQTELRGSGGNLSRPQPPGLTKPQEIGEGNFV